MRVVFLVLIPLASAGVFEDLAALGDRVEQLRRLAVPLEAELRPTVKALPTTSEGCLGPAASRYALHRLFVQKGWFVKTLQDLDPTPSLKANASSPVGILQDQVPTWVKRVFEDRLQSSGLCLEDLAALAGLLEDLVHRETMQRVSQAFKAKRVPLVGRVSVADLSAMLDYVMMSYILEVIDLEGTPLEQDVSKYLRGERPMEEIYPNWPKTQKFLRDIQGVVAPARRGSLNFQEITHVVEEINEHYGRWHDEVDCLDMKNVLFGMESCPGRVDLSRFYAASVYEEKWQFSESVQYLRDLGALDETVTTVTPQVVISNYVSGASNCIGTSKFYAQCCVDPCDELLAKLEKALAAPAAPAAAVQAAVEAVLPAPRPVEHGLEEIAHDGLVVIHGRLFAQWLHHAYPRSCPLPPSANFRLRQELPKDFSLRTGKDYVASDSEMRRLAAQNATGSCRLPWSHDEELLDAAAAVVAPAAAPAVVAAAVAAAAALMALMALRAARAPARGPLLVTEPQV